MSDDKRLNEVIRVRKRPNNFVMMDRAFLENALLSWKAKGILAYLLSKPDNWKVIVGDVVKHAADGKASVYSGLAELREYGYYEKVPVRNERGIFDHWESTVYELPKAVNPENGPSVPLPGFPEMDKPDMGKPDTDNRTLVNNDYSNNNYTHNHVSPSGGQDATDAQAVRDCVENIKRRIRFEDFKLTHSSNMELVTEIVSIVADALLSESPKVRIDGEDKPRALVQHALSGLVYGDVELVIERFNGRTERISKKRQYILSMLYNVRHERDAHYTNEVNAIWGVN